MSILAQMCCKLFIVFTFFNIFVTDYGYSQLSNGKSTINIISGAPLTGFHDPVGGYGDVAANLVMALELKSRNPEATINFLVTSEINRRIPTVPTTNEIMQNMVPELNSSIKDQIQVWRGINFIFLNIDYTTLAKLEILTTSDLTYLRRVIPKSDMSIQFSANNSAAVAALRVNSNISFSFNELAGGDILFRGAMEKSSDFSSLYQGKTGAGSMGYYLIEDRSSSEEYFKTIQAWSQSHGISPDNKKILFAYSKNAQALQLYIEALARVVDPNQHYVLYMQDRSDVFIDKLPANVQVVKAKSLPHEVMKALIHEAVIAPLVTGDVSLSLALSFVRAGRVFVYETLVGKKDHIVELFQKAKMFVSSTHRLLYQQATTALMIDGRTLSYDERNTKIEKLVETLKNKEIQSRISESLTQLRREMDVLSNIQHFISFNNRFKYLNLTPEHEMTSALLRNWIAAGGEQNLVRHCKQTISNKDVLTISEVSAAILLLLTESTLTSEDKLNILNALSTNNLWEYLTVNLLKETNKFKDLLKFGYSSNVGSIEGWVKRIIKTHSLTLEPTGPSSYSQLQCKDLILSR